MMLHGIPFTHVGVVELHLHVMFDFCEQEGKMLAAGEAAPFGHDVAAQLRLRAERCQHVEVGEKTLVIDNMVRIAERYRVFVLSFLLDVNAEICGNLFDVTLQQPVA